MSEFINTVDTLGDDAMCDRIITKTLTEYMDSYIKSIGDYALYSCTSLNTIDLPNTTLIGLFAFYGCSKLKTINLPVVEVIDNYGFYGNTVLDSIHIPLVRELGKSAFYNCNNLARIDLPSAIFMDAQVFYNCRALTTVIMRSETMCEIVNVNAFANTPISNGTGFIYVPSALVDSYRNGTNWSAYSEQIRSIDDYPDIVGG